MKKLFALLLSVLMVFSLAACKKAEPLADKDHALWTAHGQYLLADGTPNSWNGKDSELYEKAALTAITLEDVKKISEDLYKTLQGKNVKYLYTIDLIFGTTDAGWTSECLINGVKHLANGSYCFKFAPCNVDVDGDSKVYAEDFWIHDPKIANVESLTPDTVFEPTWQEEPDANGFSWASNPVVIGGPGLYTVVLAQYSTVSAAGTPGFGVAMFKKEAKEGGDFSQYIEIKTYVPADHKYGVVGSFNGWGGEPDVEMTAGEANTWTGEVELKAGDEIKVRADSDWTNSWGNGADNFKIEEDGTYVVTITFEGENGTVTVVKK
ncbi:MAG: hypothetical protein IJM15_04525 [Erysipelotrichaceae bacterium]|nr:hypothetical protein [Erysipelotrichaceae bacterium]